MNMIYFERERERRRKNFKLRRLLKYQIYTNIVHYYYYTAAIQTGCATRKKRNDFSFVEKRRLRLNNYIDTGDDDTDEYSF